MTNKAFENIEHLKVMNGVIRPRTPTRKLPNSVPAQLVMEGLSISVHASKSKLHDAVVPAYRLKIDEAWVDGKILEPSPDVYHLGSSTHKSFTAAAKAHLINQGILEEQRQAERLPLSFIKTLESAPQKKPLPVQPIAIIKEKKEDPKVDIPAFILEALDRIRAGQPEENVLLELADKNNISVPRLYAIVHTLLEVPL